MRITAAVLLIGALAAPPTAPARAQTGADAARCAQALAPLLPLLSPGTPPVLADAAPDRCAFGGVRLEYGEHLAFTVGALVLKNPPPATAANPAGQRRIELHDVIPAFQSGNPALDWLQQQQQIPIDITADVTENQAAHTLTVNELSLHGEDVGQVSLTALVERIGADDPATGIPALANAGIRSLHLQTDSRRFFVKYVLPILVGTWHGGDPDANMAAAKLQAMDGAREAMAFTRSTPQSIEAVLAFLQDLPKPRHVLDLSVTATAGPLTADDADDAATSMMGLATVLAALRVTATYDQTAH